MNSSRLIDPGVMFAILLSVVWIAATALVSVLGWYEFPRNGSHLTIIVSVLLLLSHVMALLKIAASDRDKPIAVAP